MASLTSFFFFPDRLWSLKEKDVACTHTLMYKDLNMCVGAPLHLYFVHKGKKAAQQAREADLKWWFLAKQETGRDVPAQHWSTCCRWGEGLGQTRLRLMLEGFALCREDKFLWLTSMMLDQGSKEEWFQGMVWDIFPAIHSVTLLSLNCCFLCYASLEHLRAWLGVQEGFIIIHKEYTQELLFKILVQPKKFFTGPWLAMKPLNQCHILGVILLASAETVNSVQYTDFNQRPLPLRAGRSPVAFKGKFTDNENHLVFDVQPRYLPTGSLPMFAN